MKDVLIVGGGPTGLVLALWLTKQGAAVRIIDQTVGPGETSRAMAVQARTLELYGQLGLADAVVAAGYPNPSVNLWAKGKRRAHVVLGDAGADLTPYPFVLVYPQDRHERLLLERLFALGISVERQTELIAFDDKGDRVAARLRTPGGGEETCVARYIAGCDGARSTVRHQLGIGFKGGTYKHLFYVADVAASGLEPAGEVHVSLDRSDFVLVMPYDKSGLCRLIGTVQDERVDRGETLTFADVDQDAIKILGLKVNNVNWFSTYRVHHRVADNFRRGRAFLLGDAAHVHSPVGGQGMNTGILDAVNLAWKLTAVMRGQAPDRLLDSYEQERQAFARKLVNTTDRLFSLVTAEGSFAEFVKTYLAPGLIGLVYNIHTTRELMFRLVSQTMVSYGESPLSAGKAGKVMGGDRLPWVLLPGADNYAPLAQLGWQVHIYGAAQADVRTWCDDHQVALHVFPWQPEHGNAGLLRDAAYLLRPDTYVALADPYPSAVALDHYFTSRDYFLGRSDAEAR